MTEALPGQETGSASACAPVAVTHSAMLRGDPGARLSNARREICHTGQPAARASVSRWDSSAASAAACSASAASRRR